MSKNVTLTTAQQEAIDELNQNLQIIACAGSGKTEVITRRIANILQKQPEVKPENIVAFTFTNKAADSMRARIASALNSQGITGLDTMFVGTIHSFCSDILTKCTDQFRDYKILDTVKEHLFVERYYKSCGMGDLKLENFPRNIELFLQCIEKMIDDFDNTDAWEPTHQEILNKYIQCLYSHQYIDFSLVIFETLRQMESNPQIKARLSQIQYLVVDEYQDINNLQEKLILRIAEAGANICVVGDDDQTIYQFRGSNADNMITFAQRYAHVHQVHLEQNFRCAPGIVDVADCVIANNAYRLPKKMISGAVALQADIEANRYDDKEAEFAAIAERIEELHRAGVPYREIAILVRKGKLVAQLSPVLNRAGIPYEADSAENFFTGDYFQRFVDTLRILNDVDRAKLKECWQDFADASAIITGFKFLRGIRGGFQPFSRILCEFCEKINFLDDAAEDLDARRMSLDGIKRILDDFDEIYGDYQLSSRVDMLLKFLAKRAAQEYRYTSFQEKSPDNDAVQIMTVHKAKGLEFHTVFLPELTKNEFPARTLGGKQYYHVLGGTFAENKDKYQSTLDDERKLFYVAVTRAKQNLYMSYASATQPVSCFVQEAAQSPYLQINDRDLTCNPKASADSDKAELAQYARSQLQDYYTEACRIRPEEGADLKRIEGLSPDEMIAEAERNCLL